MTIPFRIKAIMSFSDAALFTLLLLGAACGQGDKREAGRVSDTASADSMGVAPTNVTAFPLKTTRNLRESSALAMSREQDGVLFTINDSGNEPVLFALDTSGADRGAWRVKGARNIDWEALAVGPCGTSASNCVYIGDVGDNDAVHPTRTIYRVAEPIANASAAMGSISVGQSVTFTYADRAHDVEAMYVARNGDVFLITKRALATESAHLRPALVFRISSDAWTAKNKVTAELIDSLSIVPGSAPFRAITDAALSPDGKHVAVRTYSQLYVYSTDATSGRVLGDVPAAVCNLAPLGEAQGEGVTWLSSSGRFAFSSEGREAPLHLANCPLSR